jgi:hypothetical protein
MPDTRLTRISAGGKYAIATRNQWALQGAQDCLRKDWIDRRFVRIYQGLY